MVPVSAGWQGLAISHSMITNQVRQHTTTLTWQQRQHTENLSDRCEQLLCRPFSPVMESRDQINSSVHWTGPSEVDSDAEQAVSRSSLIPAMMTGRYSRRTLSPFPIKSPHPSWMWPLRPLSRSRMMTDNHAGQNWDGIRSLCPCGKDVVANEVINQTTNTRPRPYLLNLPPISHICLKHQCSALIKTNSGASADMRLPDFNLLLSNNNKRFLQRLTAVVAQSIF